MSQLRLTPASQDGKLPTTWIVGAREAVLDQLFNYDGTTFSSKFLISTTSGVVVFENTEGEIMVTLLGAYLRAPIKARRILTGATLNGTPYTTTATGIYAEGGL